MATDQSFVEYVAGQIADAGDVTFRKMFGEYGMHCDGKFFSLICDNKFFIKPTEAGHTFIEKPVLAPPYPGAKDYFLIEEQLEDREWVTQLVKITVQELPPPKPKRKKKPLK